MEFIDVVRALPSFDDKQLRELNKYVVTQLMDRRKVERIIKKQNLIVGNTYVMQGIRPYHLNGMLVRITGLNQVTADVENAETKKRLGRVPVTCLHEEGAWIPTR